MSEEAEYQHGEIVNVDISNEMKKSYLDYAMSVIVARAIPDVCDGLKPVHRRIIYSMYECGYEYNKPFKKCARIVGDVMGKYHPHGDSSIYEALVRMAQDFSMGVTLINGQGNFGSIDDDPPAAMRYTEARMEKITSTMTEDLDKDTVNFTPNYDGTEKEPSILPTRFPNLLVNGSAGIAVGMATNVPTHNLCEVIDGVLAYIDNRDITVEELVEIIPAPDFPTNCLIIGKSGYLQAAKTGRGSVIMRGETYIEEKKGRETIIIKSIPYQVIKSKLAYYGSEVIRQEILPDSKERIIEEIKKGLDEKVDMIICTGGMSVDPDDVTPTAIKECGGELITYGAPILPGAMFLLAYYNDTPILGIPSCAMYSKRTVLDLVLPRVLADERLTLEDIASYGHGGLCLDCKVCTFPHCSFGK